jgi:hypothetical protein
MLFALFLAGALAAGTELLLLGHFEDRPQWIPLVLLALGFVWGGVTVTTPRHWSVRTFQVLMAAFAASGFIGQYLHYRVPALPRERRVRTGDVPRAEGTRPLLGGDPRRHAQPRARHDDGARGYRAAVCIPASRVARRRRVRDTTGKEDA